MNRGIRMWAVAAGILIAFRIALLPADASAGVDQWTALALPSNAHATAVATDPAAAATVYVAAGSLLFKSPDGGATWTTTDLSLLRTDEVAPVLSAVLVDPDDPRIVLVGADFGRVYRSHDAGATWARNRIDGSGGSTQTIHGFEIGLGTYDEAALAATSNGVWFTISHRTGTWDVDRSWTEGGSVAAGCRHVHAIAVHPQNNAVQYAGTNCGLFKTTAANNAGEPDAWQRVVTVPNDAAVRAIVIDPLQPDTLYVATDQGIRRLTGGGGTATLVSNNGLQEQSARALAIDPINNSLLYAGLLTQGMFKGNPAGSGAWIPFDAGLGAQGISALSLSWPDPRRLYAVTAGGDVYGIVQSHVPAPPMDLSVAYMTPPPASISLGSSGGSFSAVGSVRNLGPGSATGIKYTLSFEKLGALLRPVPAWPDVTVASMRATQGTCTVSSTKAFCDLGTLAPGTSAQVTFRVSLRTSLRKNQLTTLSAVSGEALGDLWSVAEGSSGNNRVKAYTNVK